MEAWADAISWPGISPCQLVLVTDDQACDGRFLLMHQISSWLRKDGCVFILSGSEGRSHFEAVVRKFGIDVARAESEGSFIFANALPSLLSGRAMPIKEAIDGASGISEVLVGQHTEGPGSSPSLGFADILSQIKSFLEERKGMPCLLVVDDLSLLEGIFGRKPTLELLWGLRLIRGQFKDSATIVRMDGEQDSKGIDRPSSALQLLAQEADVLIEIQPLSSGYVRDIHGLVTIYGSKNSPPETANFKVLESSIRCGRISR